AVGEPVARGRRRGLGYPSWALVHDPAHAKEALSVVKDIERATRRARTKPGLAIDLFEQLAAGLPTPHLPSFWEQAGRAFVASGNTRQAAMFFGRARETEQVYALPVDEELRRTVYLEFAFAGALTVKAIASYGDELARRYPGERAHAEFTELVVRRSLGGLPPWTELPKQIKALATGAGLDAVAEEAALLDILLPLPATRHAPAGFWKSARSGILRRDSVQVRGLLLHLFPSADGLREWWLDLLGAAGAFDLLLAEGAEPAAWFSRMVQHTSGGWRATNVPARLLTLVPFLARRLIADAVPVRLTGRIDADLLDLLVAEGVPVETATGRGCHIDLASWRVRDGRRDLSALAAEPRLTRLLKESIARYADGATLDDLVEVAALRPHAEQLTAEKIAAVTGGGHGQAELALAELERQIGGATLAAFPDQRAALEGVDLAVPLARTLRAGIMDELGWDALDAAGHELQGKEYLSLTASWPVLTLCGPAKAIAVGPEGRVAEHDLRITGERHGNPTVVYADGQFLVMWWGDGGVSAYWSGDPADVFTPQGGWYGIQRTGLGTAMLAPDGGRISGGQVLRAGDRRIPDDAHVLFDGETHWALGGGWPSYLQEFEPVSGRLGRRSQPAFFEDAPPAEGEVWSFALSSLGVLPEGVTGSPLGQRGRSVGFAVGVPEAHRWQRSTGTATVRGVDGRSASGDFPETPWGLLKFPGSEEIQAVAGFPHVTLIDPENGTRHWNTGTSPGAPALPPPSFWHFLRPRDEAGSALLRAMTVPQARALLDAEVCALPGVTDQRLLDGVARFVKVTADLLERRDALLRKVAAVSTGLRAVDDDGFRPAVAGLVADIGSRDNGRPLQDLEVVARFLTGGIDAATAQASAPYGQLDWTPLLGGIGSAALRAASPATPAEHRELLTLLLEVWAGTPFADPAAMIHTGVVTVPDAKAAKIAETSAGGATIGVTGRSWSDVQANTHTCRFVAVGDSPPVLGEIGGIAEIPVGWGDAARLLRFVELLAALGPHAWDPQAARSLSGQTGLSFAAAALLLAGLPHDGRSWRPTVGTHARTVLGLKAKEAEGAVAELNDLDVRARTSLLSSAMPTDPADLWEPGGLGRAADRLAEAWIARYGRRPAVPEPTLATVSALVPNLPAAYLCGQLLAPDQVLTEDAATWLANANYGYDLKPDSATGARSLRALVDSLVLVIPWLYATLPAGDPVRAGVPRALALLLDRLNAPGLVFEAGYWYAETAQDQTARFGDRPYRGRDPEVKGLVDDGLTIAAASRHLYYRPAVLGDDVRSRLLESCVGPRAEVRSLRSPGYAAIADRIGAADLADGAYEADPRACAPALVAMVGDHLGVEEDPAVLYLQLLTLLEPTDRNVRTWNGWTPARHRKALAVLEERGLVMLAKRARAGRGAFLPGGWAQASSPDLPLEIWKLPLYDMSVPAVGRQASGPLRRFLPLRPLPEIFAAAWQRVLDGDGPR
ncbi:MAG: hypothetical protein ABIS86_12515, partial [Streptosporangiaceae bacterium]